MNFDKFIKSITLDFILDNLGDIIFMSVIAYLASKYIAPVFTIFADLLILITITVIGSIVALIALSVLNTLFKEAHRVVLVKYDNSRVKVKIEELREEWFSDFDPGG